METLAETLHRINESLAIIRLRRPVWSEKYTMERCWTEVAVGALEPLPISALVSGSAGYSRRRAGGER